MEIRDAITEQNKAFVFALNRKLGDILPDKLIIRFISENNDSYQIASLMVKTHNELHNPKVEPLVQSETNAKEITSFQKFVSWIKRKNSE
ncbi:hypothetical protein [Colwellia sp. PAMC 21821]|uniref:hypothetical protein n=1 Tax=Colwellia sp. PAMC 21821 TaxID=1816219 RepID=UPI0009BD4B5B|nr:hypothetical protein [Colwellia sp. PAMC 21821]ARD45111.1 hypothetical protein A3Q33_12800 [Colwellia sp. PAMC 21821]